MAASRAAGCDLPHLLWQKKRVAKNGLAAPAGTTADHGLHGELPANGAALLERTDSGEAPSSAPVSVPDLERWRSHTPVLVDDIASTAIETVGHLRRAELAAAIAESLCTLLPEGAARVGRRARRL